MMQTQPVPLVKKVQYTSTASSLSEAYLPQSVLDDNPSFAATLERIRALERGIDGIVAKKVRKGLLEDVLPKKELKILRIYVNHTFVPSADPAFKPYYLLSLEGQLLDNKICRSVPFASFFEKVRFQADKKIGPSGSSIEWDACVEPAGLQASCVRLKLYGDKPLSIKILLLRNSMTTYANISKRFDISGELRDVIPYIQPDPTEEDVVLSVWEYVNSRGLLEGNNIRCDEALEHVIGASSVPVSMLRAKLAQHMLPPRPIQIDYIVSQGPPRGGGKSGKVIEIEVDMPDPYCSKMQQQSNIASSEQAEYQEAVMQGLAKATYIAKAIARQKERIDLLKSIASAPLCSSLSSTSLSNVVVAVADTEGSGVSAPFVELDFTVPQLVARSLDTTSLLQGRQQSQPLELEPVQTDYFSLISQVNDAYTVNGLYRGFIDVGNDELFRVHGARWIDNKRLLAEHLEEQERAAQSAAAAAEEESTRSPAQEKVKEEKQIP